MVDINKLPNNVTMRAFVTPCEHRIAFGTSLTPVCEKLAEITGAAASVDAGMCANCRLYGTVNDAYLLPTAKNMCEGNLHKVSRGFHDGPEQVSSVIEYAMKISTGDTAMRDRIEKAMLVCVGVARITAGQAHAVFVKHNYPADHPIHASIDGAHRDLVDRLEKGIVPAQVQSCCGGAKAVSEPVHEHPSVVGWISRIAGAAASMAVAVAGPQAAPEVQQQREDVCRNLCPGKDSKGVPMFRDGQHPTCGAPLLQNVQRDVAKDGCGCYLKIKWKGAAEKCPLGYW